MAPRRVALAALVAACCIYYVAGQQKSIVNVDVYYESLCPDSIYFITKELGPIYDQLKSVLKVNLYPFGKATWVAGSKNESAEFTCHHGAKECEGNIAQACAFDEIKRSLAPELQQDKQVRVAYCAMNNRGFAENVPACAEKNGLSKESIERIATCMKTNQGSELLVASGEKTKAFESPLKNVPAIVINGIKTQEATKNFTNVICEHVPKSEHPEICTRI
ncbi:GILT-like protein 1 [Phymastichus coffea]|uniref:GILT-like protein 1 n=1 Tax=Phymastichus coffea TaxID=108790 RepID=UPI00273BF22E|nr:GILT-like protein 1 [Phymastichus coffea]